MHYPLNSNIWGNAITPRTLLVVQLAALSLCVGAAAQESPLRFSASGSWGMPYGDVQKEQLVGGIVYDLSQAVGAVLKLPVRYVVLPRKRIEGAVQAGAIDVRCYFNPAWARRPLDYVFTVPLFDASDILIGTKASAKITNLTQLAHGAVIGTVLGFTYPNFDQRFDDRSLARDDAPDQGKVLRKLELGRTPYAIVNSRVADWFKRERGKDSVGDWTLVVAPSDFFCGVVKSTRFDAQAVAKAFNSLKTSGALHKILDKYR
jgi:polar amino acid transport system substrate-binding protein